jgi:hypothetical protein
VLLLVHGEVTSPEVDIFDREMVFIETVLQPLLEQLPNLKVVLEHITTQHAVSFVESAAANVAASITPQHMLLNRNALFQVSVCMRSPFLILLQLRCPWLSAIITDDQLMQKLTKHKHCCQAVFNAAWKRVG